MENKKLYIFDCDSTLTTTRSGAKFRKGTDDWMWLPGRLEKLAALKANGAKLAVATNQGGCAYGIKGMDETSLQTTLAIMCDQAMIDHLFVCYNHPDGKLEQYRIDDFDRKPKPGMLLRAMLAARATAPETVFIGDRDEDEQAARNAGVQFCHADTFFSREG